MREGIIMIISEATSRRGHAAKKVVHKLEMLSAKGPKVRGRSVVLAVGGGERVSYYHRVSE